MSLVKVPLYQNLIFQIVISEKKGNELSTLSDYSSDFDSMVNHALKTKLLLRRFEFDLSEDDLIDAYNYFISNNVSDSMLIYLIDNLSFDKINCASNLLKVAIKIDPSNLRRITLLEALIGRIKG